MLVHSFYLFIQQILRVLSTGETEGEQLKKKKNLTFGVYLLVREKDDKQQIDDFRQ